MKLLSIASGSSGNCYYVGNSDTHLLVDVGISCKRVENALKDEGIKPSELDGVLVTHEHIDHVKGIGVLARKHGVPIYATAGTIAEMKNMSSLGNIDDGNILQHIKNGFGLTGSDGYIELSNRFFSTVPSGVWSIIMYALAVSVVIIIFKSLRGM